jgi:inner membrane protein
MEPLTHGLVSYTLARAGLKQVSPQATAILLVSGYAPDWDWISLAGGPATMLHYRRVLGHSLLSATLAAALVAALFWWFGRRHPTEPIRFARALLLSVIGAGTHLLLDLPNRYGVALLWPFRKQWFSWDLAETIDPWVLAILLLSLLLPALLRLVTEEIGARAEKRSPQRWAVAALAVLLLYFGARMVLRERAVALLSSALYRRAEPLRVAAYPSAVNPLRWVGLVETENMFHELNVSLAPGSYFDPERASIYYKPEDAPALEAARGTATVRDYLQFARFPIARIERTEFGWVVEVRDLRFRTDAMRWAGFGARIELNKEWEVIKEEFVSFRAAPN